MGIYFSQALTVSGPEDDLQAFVERCLVKDADGSPIGLDFERIAPTPADLPDGDAAGPLGYDVDVGVEAISGRPRPLPEIENAVHERPSVFLHKRASKLGLKDRDSLLAWLRANRPEAIVAGQKAIDAVARTGSWTLQEWRFNNWGETYLEEFKIELSPKKAFARFYTKGMPVMALVRPMGEAFPTLRFRLAGADDGYETPFVATSAAGRYEERYVEATESFVEEVEEPANRERDPLEFYTRANIARPFPMTDVRYWFAERKVLNELQDYPVYRPPHVGLASSLSEAAAEENFAHFMATRSERAENLRRFLARFGVALPSRDEDVAALDRWMRRYGAFLTVNETGAALFTHNPSWTGPWRCYNVVFDLATWIGDRIVAREQGFHWEIYRDVASGLRKGDEHYQTPVVRGPDPGSRWRVWPLDVHWKCKALRSVSCMWGKNKMQFWPRERAKTLISELLDKPAEMRRHGGA